MKRIALLVLLCASTALAQTPTATRAVITKSAASFTGTCVTNAVGKAYDTGQEFLCIASTWVENSGPVRAKTVNFDTYVGAYATGGAGTSASPWTGWEAPIQAVIDAAGTSGITLVWEKGKFFSQGTALKVNKANSGWVRFIRDGAYIKVTAANTPTITCNRTADYDTFQYIEVSGGLVDQNSLSSTGGGVLFNCNGQRINVNDLTIRDVTLVNAPAGVGNPGAILIQTTHADDAETWTYNQRITVDNVRVSGGNYAVFIGANRTKANSRCTASTTPWACCTGLGTGTCDASYDVRSLTDAISVTNIWHKLGSGGTSFSSSTVQLGSTGRTGKGFVQNVYSEGSGDNCVEIDGGQDVQVRSVTCVNPYSYGITLYNYSNPVEIKRQILTVDDWTQTVTGCGSCGSGGARLGSANGRVLNEVNLNRFTYTRSDGTLAGQAAAIVGQDSDGTAAGVRTLNVTAGRIKYIGTATTTTALNAEWPAIDFSPGPTDLDGDGTTDFNVLNLRDTTIQQSLSCTGSCSSGSTVSTPCLRTVRTNGKIALNVDGLECDVDNDGSQTNYARSISLQASGTGLDLRAYFTRLSVVDNGSSATYTTYPFFLGSGLAATSKVVIRDSDFSRTQAVGVSDVYNSYSTDPQKVLLDGNKFRLLNATYGFYMDRPAVTGRPALAPGSTGSGVVVYGAKGTQCSTLCTNAGLTGCNDTIKDTGAFAGNCTDVTGTTYHACLCY